MTVRRSCWSWSAMLACICPREVFGYAAHVCGIGRRSYCAIPPLPLTFCIIGWGWGSPDNRRKADDSCQALAASVGACPRLLHGSADLLRAVVIGGRAWRYARWTGLDGCVESRLAGLSAARLSLRRSIS